MLPSENVNVLVSRVIAGRAFLVQTAVCLDYYSRLTRWFEMGSQGAVVYGRPRLGKTSATRWVLGAVQQLFGKVPYVEIPIRKQHLHNEGAFFQFMLKCCRNKYYNRGTVADKRDRLLEALLNRARRSNIRMVILFLDEAHELEEIHYQWLRNISNEMDMAGYRLFCLLVGQQELVDKKYSLLVDGMEQIVSRFMTEAWMFSGLKSMKELKTVLSGYDVANYPADSNRPFIDYFVPKAYANGWKLESLADVIWNEYESRWNALAIPGSVEVGMQYVTSTVIAVLNFVAKRDKAELLITPKDVKKCVDLSGFSDAMAILNSCKKVSAGIGKGAARHK